MVELGAIAGVPVVVILTCLLKCAIEVGNADEHPAEVQNLLYMQCIADCLLPSELPDPDRYKKDSDQENSVSDQSDNKDSSFEFPDEEGVIGSQTPMSITLDGTPVDIKTEFRKKVSIIIVENRDEKRISDEGFEDQYHPHPDIRPKVERLAIETLDQEADVTTNPLSISIIIPTVQRDAIIEFREELADFLHDEVG